MRPNRTGSLLLLLVLALLSGCRSASLVQRLPFATRDPVAGVSRPRQTNESASSSAKSSDIPESADPAEAESESVQQVSAVSSDETSATEAVASVPVQYTIQQAIEMALSHNPDLVALRQNENVGSAALGVAETYPFNPFIQAQATPYQDTPIQQNPPGTSGTTYHYILLMQQVQLGHQQQFREEAACAALNGIRWNILQAELLNVAQTERLYFTAVYQQGIRDLANLNANNNREMLAILEAKQQGGEATAADVAIVRLDARSTQQQQRIAEANYQTALLDLKRHLCLPPETQITLDKSVMRWNWLPASTLQLCSMAAGRPDVMATRADTETARANTCLANGNRIPDVQIGPYYQRTDTAITYVGLRAQMDIPVINSGIPMLRQREAELCQRATVAQQLSLRASLEAQAAADRYERARQLLVDAGESPHISVPIELQNLEELFKANEVDILRVIQARNSLLQNQRAELDAMNEIMQSAVAITAATGTPIESLAKPPEPYN